MKISMLRDGPLTSFEQGLILCINTNVKVLFRPLKGEKMVWHG